MKRTTAIFKVAGLVWGITIDDSGNLYYTCGSSGLWTLNIDDDKSDPELLISDNYITRGVIWSKQHNSLFACDYYKRVLQFDLQSRNLTVLAGNKVQGYMDGVFTKALFDDPYGIVADEKGDLLIADGKYVRKMDLETKTIHKLTGTSTVYSILSIEIRSKDPLGQPCSQTLFERAVCLALDKEQRIYVADSHACRIRMIEGKYVKLFAGSRPGFVDGNLDQAKFFEPRAILFEDDRFMLLADKNGLRRIDMKLRTVSTPKEYQHIQYPWCLAKDKDGNVYVGTDGYIFKLEDTWKYERFLWIGRLKEEKEDCLLALLPNELIKEISNYFTAYLPPEKKRSTAKEDTAPTAKRQRT